MKTIMTKTVMTKTLLAAALAATMGVGSTSAMAVLLPFNVTEVSVPGALANSALLAPNSAGLITGNYTETATFNPITSTNGTFDSSILWNAGQYVATNGSTVLPNQLGGFTPNQYGLYAFFMGSATYVISGGVTTATFLPGGSLNLYIDPLSDTVFRGSVQNLGPGPDTGNPITGSTPWIAFGTTGVDDYLIATGTPISGFGTLNPNLPTCDPGINCGSFGATTSFDLTSAGDPGTLGGLLGTQNGKSYFTYPDPFYNLVFTSGQFDLFTPGDPLHLTQTIHGSLDAVFGNTVPEPESLALLGIGLLGLAMSRRGRRQA